MLGKRMSSAPALFISDLHLTPERPHAIALFRRFTHEIASQASALYILGDFFESWVGDDDLNLPFHAGISELLKTLAETGVTIFFLPGNRDFLAGTDFAHSAGLTLLPDPTRLELFGTSTLLTHGDSLCTDDTAYQAFRRQVRDPAWQNAFLALPLRQRHAMARSLRERSEQAKADKKPQIMDVNLDEVYRVISAFEVTRIIHGHTHRPARHEHRVDGKACERWVLPDWYETGGYLRCDEFGCRDVALS